MQQVTKSLLTQIACCGFVWRLSATTATSAPNQNLIYAGVVRRDLKVEEFTGESFGANHMNADFIFLNETIFQKRAEKCKKFSSRKFVA